MQHLIITAVLALVPASVCAAQSIRVGPYLQDAEPDSIWVMWETTSGDESIVEYGRTGALGSVATGTAVPSFSRARIHEVQLRRLTPDTIYHYRVRTGGAVSDIHHFRTPALASAEQPFRFIAYSDTQGNGVDPARHYEVVNEGIIDFVHDEFGPDLPSELSFMMLAGDLVAAGSVYEQWKEQFFDEAQNLYQHVPLYPVAGNHEQDADHYFRYFHLPENGTPGYHEHWYYKDHGNVRIIGLDSNGAYRVQAQLDWLDGVLADAASDEHIDFVFAQLHHPHKSEVWTPGNTPYAGQVIERLEAFSSASGKPSVHFFGHTHAYSRGQSRDHVHLWVNVASGEGNIDYWGEYPIEDYPEFQRSFVDHGFVVVESTAGPDPSFRLRRISRGNEIEVVDNEVRDDITIRMHNHAPETPDPVSPAPNASVSSGGAELEATPFADPDGDAHLESHFQLTKSPGTYTGEVVDRWVRFENWFSPPGATGRSNGWYSVNTVVDPDVTHATIGGLEPNTRYYWRVRYRDGSLAWSDWSPESTFVTDSDRFGANRLANAGGELGIGGWETVQGTIESLSQRQCGAPAPVTGDAVLGVGGVCANQSAYGQAKQVIDVSDMLGPIGLGAVRARYSGWMRSRVGEDVPELWLEFIGRSGTVTRTPKLRGDVPDWVWRSSIADVPHGTRLVELHISGTRSGAGANDSYFDDLELRLADFTCYADCDVSTGVGVLDVFDFLCFQDRFISGESYACDCDASSGVGVCDILDFLCFQDEFVGGICR